LSNVLFHSRAFEGESAPQVERRALVDAAFTQPQRRLRCSNNGLGDIGNGAFKGHGLDDARDQPGNLRFEALTQTNRQNHFTVIEAWANRDAVQAHGMNAATRAFREKVAPAIGALYDERLYKALD